MSLRVAALALGLALAVMSESRPVQAAEQSVAEPREVASGTFTNKSKRKLRGTWIIRKENGAHTLSFQEGFNAPWGPDLKVFLSPLPADEVTGKNATDSSLSLGNLKSRKKPSAYEIPSGTDLGAYRSVVIHCEAFSALWGAGPLVLAETE